MQIATDDDILINGNLSSSDRIDVAAANITSRGSLSGSGITLNSSGALKLESGAITAQDSDKGGTIHLLGEQVDLSGVKIDASGTNGGGTVLIGGDYQGKGSVSNAQRTFVSRDTVINANALQGGNGGRVIVWADDTTRFSGKINARGGSVFGDGGFAEVSGKQNLGFDGITDLTAAQGKTGTLLLDPTDIIVRPGETEYGEPTTYINAQALIEQGASTSLFATRGLTIAVGLDFGDRRGSLSFMAGNDFSSGYIRTNGGSLNINANKITTGDIDTAAENTAGSITMTADDTIVTGSVPAHSENSTAGNVMLNAGNNITVGGELYAFTNGSAISTTKAGNISLASQLGDIAISRFTTAAAKGGLGGRITLNANYGSISTGGVVSYSESNSAGDINLYAEGNIDIGGWMYAFSGADGYLGDGGDITLTSVLGGINVGGYLTAASENGIGGNITLASKDDITTQGIGTYANSSSPNKNAGNIALLTTSGNITTDGYVSAAAGGGNGGAIELNAVRYGSMFNNDKITTQGITTTSQGGNGGAVKLLASSDISTGGITSFSESKSAGDVSLTTTKGDVTVGDVLYAFGGTNGDGGDVTLKTSAGDIGVSGFLTTATTNGKGGSILLDAADGGVIDSGKVTTKGVVSYSEESNGGNITVKGDGDVVLDGRVTSQAVRPGLSGDISITSNAQNITVNGAVRSDSSLGTGGDIAIDAGKFVKVTGSENIDGVDFSIYTDSVDTTEPQGASIKITNSRRITSSPSEFIIGNANINGTSSGVSDGFATFERLIRILCKRSRITKTKETATC
ncbi:beta strand repeat-containing protein [Pseudanabaena sp. PCC 6802]|uniref:beta strand repeat-containing protein n=1 Tax=Pseudanabaena sp. PCC 6802 TaxID=118173 RepID=UPI000349BF57|nr:hypothetical protein [Pseudanabaena sp. PCC 6802]